MCNSCNDCRFLKNKLQKFIIKDIIDNILYKYYIICTHRTILEGLDVPFHIIKLCQKEHNGYHEYFLQKRHFSILRYTEESIKVMSMIDILKKRIADSIAEKFSKKTVQGKTFWEKVFSNIANVYFSNVHLSENKTTWNFVCSLNNNLYLTVKCVKIQNVETNETKYVFNIFLRKTLEGALDKCRIFMSKRKSEFSKMCTSI
jgi:hypothetical protein